MCIHTYTYTHRIANTCMHVYIYTWYMAYSERRKYRRRRPTIHNGFVFMLELVNGAVNATIKEKEKHKGEIVRVVRWPRLKVLCSY